MNEILIDSTGVENEIDAGYSALFVSSRNSSLDDLLGMLLKLLCAQCPQTLSINTNTGFMPD